ncbi:hypothetical protein [Variovorax sp. PAMC26660]|uniref:hypothetical protein n=1 Tax=Variovorax sp. PAMC26660 TaxID=2762322 RepID=UPI0021C33C93|nr:hypothetical protein [Variovorax sp. PAMC26660]
MARITTPAKVWLLTFFVGFAVISAMLSVTLATPIPYGDLSRIGRLSDHQFGWLAPPPKVDPELLRGTPIDQADIVVIGDSFSMTYRWQSALVKAGYRVSTTYWLQFGEALCGDMDDWLAKAGFRGKLVIVESVERLLNERLRSSAQCPTMTRPYEAKLVPFSSPLEDLPAFALNWNAQLTSGLTTYRNTQRAIKTPGDTVFNTETMARPVQDGCKFFSNRLCDKALFLSEDIRNGELTPANVEAMKTFTAARRTPLLWMVIPNKTTVYVDHDHSKDFVTALRGSNLGPDLFGWAQTRHALTRDFFFPNDTHLSMHGQLELGELMLNEVRKKLPEPPSRHP